MNVNSGVGEKVYSVHFFPHREIGQIWGKQRRRKKSLKFLDRSDLIEYFQNKKLRRKRQKKSVI